MSEQPAWLADEPELQALLHAVLDRFDQQPGSARQLMIFLPAQAHLPSLSRNDPAADQLWALVEWLEREGVLQVREVRRTAYDPRWQGARLAFALESEETLRRWLGREPTARAMEVWRRAVEAGANAFPGSCEPLLQRRIAIAGRKPEEVIAGLTRIATLTGPATLRQLSAFAFWGNSKVLDERGDLVATLFPQVQIVERTIVVAVHLPVIASGTLFIENQDTYTAATRGTPAQTRDLALVYASGFRSSAQRIRTRAGALLHYAGPGAADGQPAFERWWLQAEEPAGPVYFWGDLDFAGMQILKSLRQRFGEVTAWRPGYGPMLDALRDAGGYRGGADSRGQVDPLVTGCAFADEVLLPVIREFGQLDQEYLMATSQLPAT
jgi:hypothetical protein